MLLPKIGLCALFAGFFLLVPTATATFLDEDAEEKQAILHAERFLSILEKNPQRGTALEKVFVHHLQRGTLDAFIQSLEKRTQAAPNDGRAWMLLGLFESQRRFDSQAVIAFAQAEKLRSEDALPAFYRGQCLLRTGEPADAIDAFEAAILRKPTRMVMLELYEQIGRTHLRQNRNDLALECWKRMEAMFPEDLRVLEQIANIQKQEGALKEAFAKFERLSALTKDAYQRTQFRIEATQLQIQLGERDRGLASLTTILSELKPDGWLFRDVQSKIEEVFLAGNDRAGLIQFYESRLQQSPDDIESMVRLAKFLTQSARVAEANEWMTQAIERAPSRLEIRRSLIELLISDQQTSAAIEQYRQLSKLDPTNMDTLREWGKLVLRDTTLALDEGKKEASRIWSKMLESRPDDALLHIQIAELLMSAQIPDGAEKLFERALQLAPDETQYREYFGDFLFQQSRREEAFAIWDAIAQGEQRNAQNVMRLAEIYQHANELEKSVGLAKQACELAPKDPMVFLRAAKMQSKARRFDDVLKSLAVAERLAESEEQRESIIQGRMDALEKSNRLKQEAATLREQLQTVDKSDVTKLAEKQLLVRYLVRLKHWPDAQRAVTNALSLDGNSFSMLLAASEIAGELGDASKSIETLQKLADFDRRRRQEYLQKIARLQVRQKKFVDAIETAKQVVQAMPSKIEGYEFMAQICFQANRRDLGFETLRKAFRIDPGSMDLTIALGNALAESQKHSEAIELYWQALVKATKLDDKLDLATRLTKLHQSRSGSQSAARNGEGLSPLIERLESAKQDPAQRHDLTLCLSQVYQDVSDFASAQRVLEELLSGRARDSNLLKQLSKVCVAAGDIEKGIEYQEQLVALLPGQETESQLANLLRQHGDWNEANAIVMKLLQSEKDPAAVVQNIDSLLHKGERELVLESLKPMLQKQPENWELLFRKGLALAGIDEWTQSLATMEQILRLEADRNDSSFRDPNYVDKKGRVAVETVASNEQGAEASVLSAAKQLETMEHSELLDIAAARGGLIENTARRGMGGANWSPKTYGEVRWACIASLVCAEAKEPQCKSLWITETLERLRDSSSRLDWLDAFAIARYRQDCEGQFQAIANLIESGETYLNHALLAIVHRRQVSGVASENKAQRPLTSEQLGLLKTAYESVKDSPAIALSTPRSSAMQQSPSYQWPTYGTNIVRYTTPSAGTRPMQTVYLSLQTAKPQQLVVLQDVVNELRFAQQADEAEAFLTRLADTSQSAWQLSNLCEFFLRTERFKDIEKPLQRWFELELNELKENGAKKVVQVGGSSTGVASSFALESPTDFAYRIIENHGDDLSPEFLVRCVELAADISSQQFRNRAFMPLTPAVVANSAMVNIAKMNMLQNQSRGVINQSQMGSPIQSWAVNFVSASLQSLLLSAGRQRDVSKVLQNRVDQSEGLGKPLATLHLVLSHTQELQPQVDGKRIAASLGEIGKDPECALIAATALMSRKNDAEARLIAENFTTTDAQDALIRELIILFTSACLNENARVESSLKVLENHKIDTQTAQWIFFVLQERSANNRVRNSPLFAKLFSNPGVARPQARTVSPVQNPGRAKPVLSPQEVRIQEMLQLSRAGKKEEAVKIARQMVSQPRVFPTASVPVSPQSLASQRIQRSTPTQPNSAKGGGNFNARKTAFEILRKHAEIEKLIEETKQRLQATPNSFVLLDLLAELYEQKDPSGQSESKEYVRMYLAEALRVRPNASQLRLHFAEFLRNSGNASEACNQYLELIRRDASLGLMTVSESQNIFQFGGRTEELLKAIREANFHSVQDRFTLLGVAGTVMKSGKGFEVGATILEKLLELDNSLLPTAIMNAYYPNEVSYPRLLKFTRDALIPGENDVAGNPWFGLDSIMALQVSESLFFRRILLCHLKEDVAGELRDSIQAAADRFPGWLAGQVMLAMIAERTNEPEESLRILITLSKNKRLLQECPEAVAYELAKLFVDRQETRMVAIKLLEPLCNSRNFLGYQASERPTLLLAKAFLAEGQRGKAVETLMKEPPEANVVPFGNPAPTEKTSPDQLAEQMLTLGMPIDSYRVLDIPKKEITRSGNRDYATVVKALNTAKRKAMETLEKMPAEKAVAESLMDRTIAARQLPALELMFRVPALAEVSGQSGSIESVLQNTLVRHAKAGQHTAIEEGLQKLATANPTDVTVFATQAIVRLEMGNSNAAESLTVLEELLSKFDPQIDELIALMDRNDSLRQVPNNLQTILTTWLVARKCYASGKQLEAAERIGRRAFNVARVLDASVIRSRPTPAKNNPVVDLGLEAELASLILFEWGRTEIQAGRIEQGLLKWKELTERVNSIEEVVKETASTAVKGSAELIWQREPFSWMLLIAHSAVDAKQLALSKAIVRQINQRRLPATVPYVGGSRKGTEQESKSSAQSLNHLLNRWPNDKETASEKLTALLPIILPGDSDVHLFVQNNNLLEEKPISLAGCLVEFANQSDRLLELRDILDQREPVGTGKLSWLILRAQVAIAAKDFDASVAFLEQLKELIHGEKQLTNIASACHAAIPAFQLNELRVAAVPILNDFLAASKRTGNYPDVDFGLFPLVREVNEYLKSK